MPLSIPAFDQYQQPMTPLRGLWHARPKEGDFFVNVEVDWLVTTKSTAVQFSLSGNSPVSLSQIAAMAVDNGRCGSDVSLIFPDSGWKLTVPAHEQLISPVFTNALMFYASAPAAVAGDTTVIQILNSIPPPIPIPSTEAQNQATIAVAAIANGSTVVIPAPTSGTINTISMTIAMATGYAAVQLVDGSGKSVWGGTFQAGATAQFYPINLTGLAVRFTGGLNLVVSNVTATGGPIAVNVYYTTP